MSQYMGWRLMWNAAAVMFTSALVLLGVLLLLSPGIPKPFLDESGKELAGSISERIRVKINGVEQGMFIKRKMRL